MSPKRSRSARVKPSPASSPSPPMSRAGGFVLRSAGVGALPVVNRLLCRIRLEEFLKDALPREDGRTKLSPTKALLVLLRNLLLSREPIYGLGEWAARYVPDLMDLTENEVGLLNDDRVGRALDKLFAADVHSLVLNVATHAVKEFGLRLDELHNDSTTVSFFGAYLDAALEQRVLGRRTVAITFGYSKDHRPDLKQLLFMLTVTADGGVPLHFRVASGNVTDDTTHRDTWNLLCQLTGRRDFLYVADSKLATRDNMAYLNQHQGRFITVLPKTRGEDAAFRAAISAGHVSWRPLWEKTDEDGEMIDVYSVSDRPVGTAEGYRLVWYHSRRKAELDAIARAGRIERAVKGLAELQDKLRSARSRYRQESKVAEAVAKILASCGAEAWIATEIEARESETFHQAGRGRPGMDTQYVRKVRTRLDLDYRIDDARVGEDAKSDGVFPLITNVVDISELELLKTYKRQPTIEKRFSQLKSDFEVAPMYLKSVHRIQALLAVYFFALLVEALMERELRDAMSRKGIESLPLYPEGRACKRPTTRRVLDLFESVQRHTLSRDKHSTEIFITDLTRVQRRLLNLLDLSPKQYGR